ERSSAMPRGEYFAGRWTSAKAGSSQREVSLTCVRSQVFALIGPSKISTRTGSPAWMQEVSSQGSTPKSRGNMVRPPWTSPSCQMPRGGASAKPRDLEERRKEPTPPTPFPKREGGEREKNLTPTPFPGREGEQTGLPPPLRGGDGGGVAAQDLTPQPPSLGGKGSRFSRLSESPCG